MNKKKETDGVQNGGEGEGLAGENGEIEEGGQNGAPIGLDLLSDELKKKIKDYIETLSDEKKQELGEKADKSIKDFEKELNKDFGGKLTEKPEDRGEGYSKKEDGESDEENKDKDRNRKTADDAKESDFSKKDQEQFKKDLESIFSETKDDPYHKALKEIAPMIDNLSGDLRDVFIKRKQQAFEAEYNDEMREKLNQILPEVDDDNPGGNNNCGDNNDGECLLAASEHIEKQMAGNKFLIVLSDGKPWMDSSKKPPEQLDRELKEAVRQIKINTEQKLIGIGLLSSAVKKYYEHNMPNVSTQDISEVLGQTIRDIIENY